MVFGLRRCQHWRTRGVYGDEINQANARLKCLDCNSYLKGSHKDATVDYLTWLMSKGNKW